MTTQRSNKLLIQMQEICDFTGLDKDTVRKLIEKCGFPAQKLEGTWYSHTEAIEDWMYTSAFLPGKPPVKRK